MKYPLLLSGFEHRDLALQVSFWGGARMTIAGKFVRSANRTYVVRDDAGRIVPLKLKRKLLDPVPSIVYRNVNCEVVAPFRWYAYFWLLAPFLFVAAVGALLIPFDEDFPGLLGFFLLNATACSFLAARLLRADIPVILRYLAGGGVYVILVVATFTFFVLSAMEMRTRFEEESLARYIDFARQTDRTEMHKGDHARGPLVQLLPANTICDSSGYPLLVINRPALRFLLRTQKYRTLNDTLQCYQRLFEADFRAEDLVAHAYQTFAVSDTLLGVYLNDWVRKMPNSYQPYLARGVFREHLGWESRGYKWATETPDSSFLRMASYFTLAEDDLFKALDLEPHAVFAIETLIDISCAMGRLDMGNILMNEGLKLCPYGSRIWLAYMFELRPRWMGSYAAMEGYARAADRFCGVNPRLRGLHGYAYWDRGSLDTNYTEAIKFYTKALSFGGFVEYYESRGEAFWNSHNYAAALSDFSCALDRSPGNPRLLLSKAKMLYFLDRLPESIVLLDSANTLDPEYALSIAEWRQHAADLLVLAGYPYYQARRDDEAIAYFSRALMYCPASGQSHYYRGMAYIHLNRLDEALDDMRSAVQCNPHHFESYHMIDWLLARRGQWDQIIAYWDRLIALEPANARAYLERSGTDYHRGDMAAARRDVEKACALGSQEACDLVNRLNKP